MKVFIIFVFLCFKIAQFIGVDFDLSTDRNNWIDPNDPLASSKTYLINSKQSLSTFHNKNCEIEFNNQCEKENENLRKMYNSLKLSKENSIDVLLKHILSRFISALNIDINSSDHIYRNADINISPHELRIIRRYLNSQKTVEEFGLREDLRVALENFMTNNQMENSLFVFFYQLMPYFALLNFLILPASIWSICRSVKKFRQLIFLFILITFSISCYFTYNKKYQEILAQRFERTEQKFGCTLNGLLSEAYDLLLSFVKIKGKSECLQHYEDLLIEPIWLIDPLQIIAEVISNFVFTPISVVGGHLNKFFNDFFINTPIHFAIIKCGFLLLLLFYLTGYRLRTIFATIEPAESISRFVPKSLHFIDNETIFNAEKSLQYSKHKCLSDKLKLPVQNDKIIKSVNDELCNYKNKFNIDSNSCEIKLQLNKLNETTNLNLAKAKEMCEKYKFSEIEHKNVVQKIFCKDELQILHQLNKSNVTPKIKKKKIITTSNSVPNFTNSLNALDFENY